MDFYDILGLIFFSALLITGLIESVLSGTWNKTYFTNGIPIFLMRIPVEKNHSNVPSSYQLEARFRSPWARSLVFREIDSNTYGFREKFLEYRLVGYTPVMHGVLVFDSKKNEVVVVGLLNWFISVFSLIWLTTVVLGSYRFFHIIGLGFSLFFLLMMGILYAIQHSRFTKVATFAAQAWKRKYVVNVGGA